MRSLRLSKVAEIVMGQSPPSSTYNSVGDGLPFFQGKAEFGDLYPSVRMFCSKPLKVAEAGDILVSVRAPVGPTNISPGRSCIGRGLAAIRPLKGLNSTYLLYFLRYHEPELAQAATGSTFPAISRSDLEGIRIPLVALPEQKRIAAILDKADRLRRLCRYALELSDTFLSSVFLEMFGDPVTNPMGWPRGTIAELGRVQTGNTPSRKDPRNYGACIEWIKSDNIVSGEMFVTRSREMLSREGLRKGRSVPPGSALVTCIAGSATTIGDVALTDRRVAFNQQINAVTPYRDVDPRFLYGLLGVAKQLVQRRTTRAMKRMISKSKFESLELIKPPMAVQEVFARVVKSLERLRTQQREAQRQADHLFQTLLHRAFRGEL